jgi:hypothetical protein
MLKTQYKYQSPSAICFEEQHDRLYVSDHTGIHVYSVIDFADIRKLHLVIVDAMFKRFVINHGYLLALSEKGFMTVLELKPPQKEQLISVTTSLNLPEQSLKIVGSSKNKRLIITRFRKSVVFIDTIEGPIFNLKLTQNDPIQSIFSDKESGCVLALATDGHLSIVKLNESII